MPGQGGVLGVVAGAAEGARNREQAGLAALNPHLRFRRRPKNLEGAVVEVKQVGRGVDGAQRPVHVELVARKALLKAARQHNLKHVAHPAVLLASRQHLKKLLVGLVGTLLPFRPELEIGQRRVADQVHQLGQAVLIYFLPLQRVLEHIQLVAEVVDGNDVAVGAVQNIRNLAGGLLIGVEREVLKRLHRLIAQIPEQPARDEVVAGVLGLEAAGKLLQPGQRRARRVERFDFDGIVGQRQGQLLATQLEASQRVEGQVAERILLAVIVGAFQKQAVGVPVAQPQVEAHGRHGVGQNAQVAGSELVGLHGRAGWGEEGVASAGQ